MDTLSVIFSYTATVRKKLLLVVLHNVKLCQVQVIGLLDGPSLPSTHRQTENEMTKH